MMRRLVCLLPILFTAFLALSQSHPRLSNNWIDMFFLNPASTDPYSSTFKAGAGGRHQWIKMPGAPTTETFTLAYFNPGLKSQFGIRGFFDKIGYTTTTDLNATYALVLDLASSSDRYCKLSMGLGGKFQMQDYDYSKIVFEKEQEDVAFFDKLQDRTKVNWDLGFELAIGNSDPSTGGNYLIGVSLQNFASLFGTETDKTLNTFANTNLMYLQYHSKLQSLNSGKNYAYVLGLSVMESQNIYYAGNHSANIWQWEGNTKVRYYYSDLNSLSLGALFRTQKEYKTFYDWGLFAEHEWQQYFATSFVYENNFANLGRYSSTWGTFEIILIWRFKPNKDLYDLDKRAVKAAYCN